MSNNEEKWKADLTTLHTLLQDALEVEHATIPPYFTAWISIMDGYNYEPKEIVKSVLIEEMLHLTLVANIFNAVGGKPNLTKPGFVLEYPHNLPHSGATFEVSIEKFSKSALETFKKIEKPEPEGMLPKGDGFLTIGQFYDFLRIKVDEMCDEYGEEKVFCGDIRLQIRPEDYYGAGSLIVVHNRNTFHDAVDEIVEQGEGAQEGIFDKDHNILGPGDGKELAHYYRFDELFHEQRYTIEDTPETGPRGEPIIIDYNKVFPLKANTKKTDYTEGTEMRKILDEFAQGYQDLLISLEDAFNGNRSSLNAGIARMFSLRNQALSIIQIPLENGENLGLDYTPPV